MAEILRVRGGLSFDLMKCIGREACAIACPQGAIQVTEHQGFQSIWYILSFASFAAGAPLPVPKMSLRSSGCLNLAVLPLRLKSKRN